MAYHINMLNIVNTWRSQFHPFEVLDVQFIKCVWVGLRYIPRCPCVHASYSLATIMMIYSILFFSHFIMSHNKYNFIIIWFIHSFIRSFVLWYTVGKAYAPWKHAFSSIIAIQCAVLSLKYYKTYNDMLFASHVIYTPSKVNYSAMDWVQSNRIESNQIHSYSSIILSILLSIHIQQALFES